MVVEYRGPKYCAECMVYHQPDCALREKIAALEAELAAAKLHSERLKKALTLLYDSWENGDPCYSDPEECTGFMGNAFQLSDKDEAEILELLKDEPVHSVASQEAKNV